MEELAHPSQATQRICHSASNKIAWSASAPLHHSSHLEQRPSLPPVGQWVSQAWELLRAGISPSTAAETMADSKTSYSQGWMSASLQQVLALGLFWPWNILHWKHTVTRLETVLTTLERAPFRRDNVNFPVRSFQSQTGKCFRSEDVTQVCWYRLKSGDWQLPLFHCRSTVVFSGSSTCTRHKPCSTEITNPILNIIFQHFAWKLGSSREASSSCCQKFLHTAL